MSKYFELFEEIKNYSEEQFVINDGKKKNQSDPIFKKVLKELDKIVANKMKQFVKAESNKLIEHLEEENVFPKFTDSKYEQARKDDLVIVVKEIYCIQPKIFHKAALEQKKTVIGFLSLLLDTSERENIITIIENVTHLSSEERRELACILRKTNLSRITSTIKLLENRKDVIDLLKALVFDNYKFTSERLHIQKAIEQNYWLFGEQYHLVSADSNFEQALKEYLYIVDGEKNETKYKIANQQHLRRPDIFICQKRKTEDAIGNFIEENIIVELKSPNVVLSINTYRQIEDYMRLISKEPKFNSQTRAWKYYAICNSVDEDIKGLYSAFKDKGKRFLVYQQENHEIYAMTWDDVFNSYMITYSSLYEKLNLNIDEIEKSIGEETFPKSRDGSNSITNRIAAIG